MKRRPVRDASFAYCFAYGGRMTPRSLRKKGYVSDAEIFFFIRKTYPYGAVYGASAFTVSNSTQKVEPSPSVLSTPY